MARARRTEDGGFRVTEAGALRIEDGEPPDPAMLLEDASYLLLEDGSRILLE